MYFLAVKRICISTRVIIENYTQLDVFKSEVSNEVI